jgi:membrane protein implicated in regulation of membrane protease activity
MFTTAFWWAIAGIALMISEFVVPGIVLVFFGIGALVTALVAWLIPALGLEWQMVIFIIVSLTSLFGLRRLLKPIFMGRTSGGPEESGELNQLVGTLGEVTQEIQPGKTGRILLNGSSWKAVADEQIGAGTPVKVTAQSNLTLTVKPNR